MVKSGKQKANAKKKPTSKKVVGKTNIKKTTSKPKALDAVYQNENQSFLDKVQTYVKNNTVTSVLIVFLVIGAIVVGVWQFMIYQERQQFNKAEAVLDELSVEIEDALGQDLEITKTKSCGYRSVKLGDPGPPGCGIRYDFGIATQDAENAVILAETLDPIVRNNFKISYYKAGIFSDEKRPYFKEDYVYEFKSNDLNCSLRAKYLYDSKTLDVGYGCSKSSKTEHFPVVD